MLITPLGLRVFVRFARKPIWMPTAPSKLFRITNHTFYDKDESEQIRKLQYVYSAQMQSICNYLKQEFYIPATKAGGMPADFLEKELAEEEALQAENDKINAKVAEQREKFFQNRLKEMEDRVLEEKMAIEEALIETGQRMDEFVKKTKSDPDSFVTPENIDAHIERAFENPTNFEFCIDKQGKKLGESSYGRNEARNHS